MRGTGRPLLAENTASLRAHEVKTVPLTRMHKSPTTPIPPAPSTLRCLAYTPPDPIYPALSPKRPHAQIYLITAVHFKGPFNSMNNTVCANRGQGHTEPDSESTAWVAQASSLP